MPQHKHEWFCNGAHAPEPATGSSKVKPSHGQGCRGTCCVPGLLPGQEAVAGRHDNAPALLLLVASQCLQGTSALLAAWLSES